MASAHNIINNPADQTPKEIQDKLCQLYQKQGQDISYIISHLNKKANRNFALSNAMVFVFKNVKQPLTIEQIRKNYPSITLSTAKKLLELKTQYADFRNTVKELSAYNLKHQLEDFSFDKGLEDGNQMSQLIQVLTQDAYLIPNNGDKVPFTSPAIISLVISGKLKLVNVAGEGEANIKLVNGIMDGTLAFSQPKLKEIFPGISTETISQIATYVNLSNKETQKIGHDLKDIAATFDAHAKLIPTQNSLANKLKALKDSVRKHLNKQTNEKKQPRTLILDVNNLNSLKKSAEIFVDIANKPNLTKELHKQLTQAKANLSVYVKHYLRAIEHAYHQHTGSQDAFLPLNELKTLLINFQQILSPNLIQALGKNGEHLNQKARALLADISHDLAAQNTSTNTQSAKHSNKHGFFNQHDVGNLAKLTQRRDEIRNTLEALATSDKYSTSLDDKKNALVVELHQLNNKISNIEAQRPDLKEFVDAARQQPTLSMH